MVNKKARMFTHLAAHSATVVTAVSYALTSFIAPGIAQYLFSLCCVSAVIAGVLHVLRKYAKDTTFPTMSKVSLFIPTQWDLAVSFQILFGTSVQENAALIIRDEHTQFLLYSLIGFAAAPSLIFLLPIVARASIWAASFMSAYNPAKQHPQWPRIAPVVEKAIASENMIYAAMAQIEVTQLGFALISIFLPNRNIVFSMLYMQYCKLRYTLSSESRQTFAAVNQAIGEKLPGVLKTVWFKFTDLLHRFASR